MKKLYFYGMVIICLFCTTTILAQTPRYWRLSAGTPGNWNDPNNWSATPLGGTGATVPNGATFDAYFEAGATVNVNIAAITLNRLTVRNATPALLVAGSNAVITVNSAAAGSEGLRIETGATLEMNCSANVPFSLDFANNARGLVEGNWYFSGAGTVNLPNGATFNLPASGFTNRLDVNGTIRFGNNTRSPLPGPVAGPAYLFFNSGSTYWLDRNGGGTPQATWNSNATIRITGMTTQSPVINIGGTPQIGNLTIDCGGLAPLAGSIELPLNNLTIQGNLNVLNTNNQPLTLLSGLTNPVALTVAGSVNISGTSVVYIGEDNDKSYNLSVAGAFNLSGGSFLMQLADGVGTNTTVLSLQGNLNHTAGTFGVTSNDQSSTNELFVVEMNGTGAQTITSTPGTIDNANNMLTLRINNATGVSLQSPVAVGKISWNSANKGIVTTTTTNYLTVRNPDAANATVVNLPASNGFVSGPVRRLTNSTATYSFPTGKGSTYRAAEIVPATTTASSYSAEYFAGAYTDLSVISPLTGVSNQEYWSLARNSGSAASIRLTLAGAIPGAVAGDGIVVAGFSGSDWVSVKGTAGTAVTPGNATSGSMLSDQLPAFNGLFTFGFGPAGALPIDLVSFNAKKTSSSAALLSWTVTASSTPDHFEVLRSTDGNSFTSIGTVQGVDQQLNYTYTDNNLPAGTTYYRLRMVDKDGDVKLSKVVVVTNGTDQFLLTSMRPTLVTDRARINVSSSQRGNLQLVITDMFGRIVKQQINGIDTGNQEIWLNLHALPAGAYQVSGYLDGKRSASIRFVKQ